MERQRNSTFISLSRWSSLYFSLQLSHIPWSLVVIPICCAFCRSKDENSELPRPTVSAASKEWRWPRDVLLTPWSRIVGPSVATCTRSVQILGLAFGIAWSCKRTLHYKRYWLSEQLGMVLKTWHWCRARVFWSTSWKLGCRLGAIQGVDRQASRVGTWNVGGFSPLLKATTNSFLLFCVYSFFGMIPVIATTTRESKLRE